MSRYALLLALWTGGLLGQQSPPYTFGTTVVSTAGLQGRVYLLKQNTEKLPHLGHLKPAGTIYTNMLDVWPQKFDEGFPGITDRFEWFAIDYTGRFWVENEGQYRFSLLADDGARLSIDGKEVIDNDGQHRAYAVSAQAYLTRGIHTIHVPYFQGPRFTVALVLSVAPPGEGWQIFNTDDFPPPRDTSAWITGSIRQIVHSLNDR